MICWLSPEEEKAREMNRWLAAAALTLSLVVAPAQAEALTPRFLAVAAIRAGKFGKCAQND